jgi:taurine dioxygenase
MTLVATPATDLDATATATHYDVRPLSASIGSVVSGLDVRHLDDRTVADLRALWLDRKVLFFTAQHLTPAEHVEFAARFGEPTEGHPVIPGIAGQPEVFEIDYTANRELYETYGDVSTYEGGVSWHTDVTFVRRPPLGSILRAVTVPEAGGDTYFSNQEAAFDALSPTLQDILRGLRALHDGTEQFKGILDLVGEGTWEGAPFRALEPVEHPVVRVHPETGRESLFVNPGFTKRLVGLDKRESDALLTFLFAHSVRPEFTTRYHWGAGDLGFWDNRATQHAVVGDFAGDHRVIQRVTLRGDEPR